MNNNDRTYVYSKPYNTFCECFEQEIAPALNREDFRSQLPLEATWRDFMDEVGELSIRPVCDGEWGEDVSKGYVPEGPVRPGFYVTVSSTDFWEEIIDKALGNVAYYSVILEDVDRPHSPLVCRHFRRRRTAQDAFSEMRKDVSIGQGVFIAEVDGHGNEIYLDGHYVPIR